MYNNYGNGNFNNNLDSNNLFNNNQYNNVNQSADYENSDIPPKLEPIKNLSDATISEAPTMDVLAPMNIMPESFSKKQDKLDEYETGVNLQNIPKQIETNYTQINNSTLDEFSFGKNNASNILETTLQQGNSILFGGQDTMVNPLINSTIENNNLEYVPQNTIQKLEENILGQNNDLSFDVINNNVNVTNPVMENQNNKLNIENENAFALDNSSFNPIVDFSGINLEMDKEPMNGVSNIDVSSKNGFDELEDSNKLHDYTILQENIEEPQMTLGIINEFDDEFDTLDILDIEDSSTNDDTTTQFTSDSESLLITNIEKIKQLISEIKNTGVEISLEEFDFENMYQLIIKINK